MLSGYLMLPSPLPRYIIHSWIDRNLWGKTFWILARQRCDQPSFHWISGRVGFRVCDTCETLSDCFAGGVVMEYVEKSLVFQHPLFRWGSWWRPCWMVLCRSRKPARLFVAETWSTTSRPLSTSLTGSDALKGSFFLFAWPLKPTHTHPQLCNAWSANPPGSNSGGGQSCQGCCCQAISSLFVSFNFRII